MSTDSRAAFREVRRLVIGHPAPILPSQKNWRGWLRAALAFQPARPHLTGPPPEDGRLVRADLTQPQASELLTDDTFSAARPGNRPTAEEVHQALNALSAGRRLVLRRDPAVTASFWSSSLATGLAEHREAARSIIRALDRAHARTVDVADVDGRIAAGGDLLGLCRSLDLGLDRLDDLGRMPVLELVLARVRISADVFARGRVRKLLLRRVNELDHALVRARARVYGLGQALARARERALELINELDGVRGLQRGDELALDHVRVRAGDLELALDHVRVRAGDLELALDHALALGGSLTRSLDVEAGRVIGLQRTDGIGAVLADGVLDDFTEADLGELDLTGMDLEGVRWSERGTRWPPGEEERIRRASRETAPGSGVWVVDRGLAADGALV